MHVELNIDDLILELKARGDVPKEKLNNILSHA
jgi:hypothetical protein